MTERGRARVASLEFAPLDVRLHAPFGIATGSQAVANNVLVRVALVDGTVGLGEAAPFPAVTGETQASTLAALAELRTSVVGRDGSRWRALAGDLADAFPAARAARCAVETALLDAVTRSCRMPLLSWFGGRTDTLETWMTVPTGSADDAAAAARGILELGIRSIKVKVGAGDVALDAARVAAIHEAAPHSPLLLDGNGGLAAHDALALLDEARGRGVEVAYFEQPVAAADLDGMRRVRERGRVRVVADESAGNAREALAVLAARAADVVNVKLMKCGIAEALDVAAVCRAAGAGLMIGGMVETILAMTASACFAAGLGGFEIVDLDTPLFLAENPFRGGWTRRGATLDLSAIHAGHGVDA